MKDLVNNCTRQRRLRTAVKEVPKQTIAIREDIARMLIAHETGIKGKYPDEFVTLPFL